MILEINGGYFPLQYYMAGTFIGDEVHSLWRETKFLCIIQLNSVLQTTLPTIMYTSSSHFMPSDEHCL